MNEPEFDPPTENALRYVRERLADGESPNDIVGDIDDALKQEATDWVLWGDGEWRTDTVCPTCGDPFAGVCGHRDTAGPVILRREWMAAHPEVTA
jgi:hypothetical protein